MEFVKPKIGRTQKLLIILLLTLPELAALVPVVLHYTTKHPANLPAPAHPPAAVQPAKTQ